MIAAIKRTISISDDDIDTLTDELMEMYPAAIAVYYEECIRAIRAKAISLSEPDHNMELKQRNMNMLSELLTTK